MPKFKTKPIIVDAIQYPGFFTGEIREFVGEHLKTEDKEGIAVTGFFVKTTNNRYELLGKNDWIVKNSDNSITLYDNCKFEQKYGRADNENGNDSTIAKLRNMLSPVANYFSLVSIIRSPGLFNGRQDLLGVMFEEVEKSELESIKAWEKALNLIKDDNAWIT